MMSYKSFMQTQSEDLSPDQFQARYEQYQKKYLDDFSNTFFDTAKRDEWFQARYNPVKLVEVELENVKRAASESAALRAEVLADPEQVLPKFFLGPEKGSILQRLGGAAPSATGDEVVDPLGKEQAAADDNDVRHLRGHHNCTLSFGSIHASCTKALFSNAISDALAAATEPVISPASRIIIGPPFWVGHSPPRFECGAWVVMSSGEEAKNASNSLSKGRFSVPLPGPWDEQKGEITQGVKVQPEMTRHSPHEKTNYLPEFFSHEQRVTFDTARAIELASKLDDARQVPEDSRLATILQELEAAAPAEDSALAVPTARLDLAIAYLRRVHLVAYYLGQKFLDEGHLLAVASHLTMRCGQFKSTAALAAEGTGAEQAVAVPLKRKERDEDGGDDVAAQPGTEATEAAVGGQSEGEGEAAAEGKIEGEAAAEAQSPSSAAARRVTAAPIDALIDEMLTDVRPSMVWTTPADHEDAQTIVARQEKVSPLSLSLSLSLSHSLLSTSVPILTPPPSPFLHPPRLRRWTTWCSARARSRPRARRVAATRSATNCSRASTFSKSTSRQSTRCSGSTASYVTRSRFCAPGSRRSS